MESWKASWNLHILTAEFACFVGHKKETENDGALITLTSEHNKCDCHEMLLSHQTIQSIKHKSAKIKELIREYEEYYDTWLQRVRAVEHDENGITPQMVWATHHVTTSRDLTCLLIRNSNVALKNALLSVLKASFGAMYFYV